VSLAVIETHPVQYHAPVYRALEQDFGIPVTAIYASDFSVAGYRDPEFGTTFAWDTDLLSGYSSMFLSRVARGGARTAPEARAAGLPRALRAARPAAVLLVGYSPRFYQVAALVALRTGRPLLFRAETTDHAVKRGTVKHLLRDAAIRLLYDRCARLLYIGERSRQHFKRLGYRDEKLLFSPYCVETRPFHGDEGARQLLRDRTRAELGIPEHRVVVLLSGKLVTRKRPDLILHALKRLPAALRVRTHVLALGTGPEQPAFEQLAREEPSVAVTCVGFQNQTRLSAYYHASDVLVLPSATDETWGLVVNEALHHGVPCVVSDAGGCAPDLIEPERTGETFTSQSATSLAAALQRVMRLVGQPGVRHYCRQKVTGYSVERSAAGIARAYAATQAVSPVGVRTRSGSV
jgi:glycosyltransferase involved in cell wall biosynthesis